jgi:hypothetical protein
MEPNPEQTASVFSMWTYSFLDPIVFLAYRVPHLAFSRLPPLADYDHTHNLKVTSFKVRWLCRLLLQFIDISISISTYSRVLAIVIFSGAS